MLVGISFFQKWDAVYGLVTLLFNVQNILVWLNPIIAKLESKTQHTGNGIAALYLLTLFKFANKKEFQYWSKPTENIIFNL